MGTNFYVRGHQDEVAFHLGKRSAAGWYCLDCRVTLCMGGNDKVHDGPTLWYPTCPQCGAWRHAETLTESAAGRELGWNQSTPGPKTGVASCSSWSWGVDPASWRELAVMAARGGADDPYLVEDEYGDLFTMAEFEAVLSECPMQFTEHIGVDFS